MKIGNQGFAPLLIVGLVALLGVGGAGVAAVADGARPGDALDGVDQAVEGLRRSLTTSPEARARLEADLATERINEAASLAAENRTQHVQQALDRYATHLNAAQQKAAEAKLNGKDTEEVQQILAENVLRHQDVLLGVYDQVPEQAQPAIERALENSQRGYNAALEALSNGKAESLEQMHSGKRADIMEKLQDRGLDNLRMGDEVMPSRRPGTDGEAEVDGMGEVEKEDQVESGRSADLPTESTGIDGDTPAGAADEQTTPVDRGSPNTRPY